MCNTSIVKTVGRQVKPLVSLDNREARRRVFNLYRAWYRQLPYIAFEYDIPNKTPELKTILRREFDKNRKVTDIRVIDMLVIKGQMELKETVEHWKQSCHVTKYMKDTIEPKPTGFLSKFLAGQP